MSVNAPIANAIAPMVRHLPGRPGQCGLRPTSFQESPDDSNFRGAGNIPTKSPKRRNILNSIVQREISAGLGDQGSQVRVLSPRFAAHCTAVKPLPPDCSGFQVAGITHSAATSVYSLIDGLSCRTTLSLAAEPRWCEQNGVKMDRLQARGFRIRLPG
jgi:hypothetical protein